MFKLLCSFTKKKTGSVFSAFCHTTFHHALIACCNVVPAGYIAVVQGLNLFPQVQYCLPEGKSLSVIIISQIQGE